LSLVALARVEVRLLLVTIERLGGVRLGIGLIRLLILLPIADHRRQLVMLRVLDLHWWLTLMTQGITTDGGRSELGRSVGIDAIEKIFNLDNLALDGRVVAVLQLAQQTLDLLDVQVSKRGRKRGIRWVSLGLQNAFWLVGVRAWILIVSLASIIASLRFRIILLTRIF